MNTRICPGCPKHGSGHSSFLWAVDHGAVRTPSPCSGGEGAAGPLPGDEGAVVDEAFGQEDACLFVALHGGPVMVPADLGVIAQVAGGALEGQPVTLEHHLA